MIKEIYVGSDFMFYTDDERKKKLGVILRKIHHLIPPIDIDTYAIGDYEIRKGFLDGHEIKRLIVYLRATGCQWMLDDENGGCAMCGHLAGTTRGGEKLPQRNMKNSLKQLSVKLILKIFL